jgi:hypothetical protein
MTGHGSTPAVARRVDHAALMSAVLSAFLPAMQSRRVGWDWTGSSAAPMAFQAVLAAGGLG